MTSSKMTSQSLQRYLRALVKCGSVPGHEIVVTYLLEFRHVLPRSQLFVQNQWSTLSISHGGNEATTYRDASISEANAILRHIAINFDDYRTLSQGNPSKTHYSENTIHIIDATLLTGEGVKSRCDGWRDERYRSVHWTRRLLCIRR